MSPSGNTGSRHFGPAVSPSRNTGPRVHDASPNPWFLASCHPHSFGEKSQEAALTAREGARGSEPLLLDEKCDSSVDLREQRPVDLTGGRGVTTDPSGSVGSSSCSTGTDAARCAWVSMREDERGPADPVDVFRSGARVSGNKSITREGYFPSGLLEKRDEVAILVDSSLTGKMIERPLLSRGNTGSSLAKDIGVLAFAFPHLKPTATTWSGRDVLVLAFSHLKPTATTWSARGGGEHVR